MGALPKATSTVNKIIQISVAGKTWCDRRICFYLSPRLVLNCVLSGSRRAKQTTTFPVACSKD
jgi:hypothetical protein